MERMEAVRKAAINDRGGLSFEPNSAVDLRFGNVVVARKTRGVGVGVGGGGGGGNGSGGNGSGSDGKGDHGVGNGEGGADQESRKRLLWFLERMRNGLESKTAQVNQLLAEETADEVGEEGEEEEGMEKVEMIREHTQRIRVGDRDGEA